MFALELSLLGCTLLGGILGPLAIWWARGGAGERAVPWGQRLFLALWLVLSVGVVVGALCHAYALSPLGLCTGLLVVAMLWEMPHTPTEETALTLDAVLK